MHVQPKGKTPWKNNRAVLHRCVPADPITVDWYGWRDDEEEKRGRSKSGARRARLYLKRIAYGQMNGGGTFPVRDIWITVVMALACLLGSPAVFAQDQSNPPSAPEPAKKTAIPAPPKTHRFWDKENDWLFAGVGASRTLDYFSTLNFRRRGDHEVLLTDDLVDNHAALAAVEAGATGLSIGVSYLFHRYGH